MNCIQCGDGFCTCSNDAAWIQTQGTLFAWFLIAALCAIFIVFVAFGVSSYKILNAPKAFDQQTGRMKYAGIEWLYLSPLCVGASAYLITIGLSLFFYFVSSQRERASVQVESIFLIIPTAVFVVGVLVTLASFIGKNWKPIVETIKERSFFAPDRKWSSVGIIVILVIAALPIPIVAFDIAIMQIKAVQAASAEKRQLADAERPRFDQWVGQYKMSTRNDPAIVTIKKADSGDALLYRVESADGAKSSDNLSDDVCQLIPTRSRVQSYFSLENCLVNGKPSTLQGVSFKETKDGGVMMHFTYRFGTKGSVLGDNLRKIE